MSVEILSVYKETYKLLKLTLDNTQHMPKTYRFTLTDRLINAAANALEFAHRASDSKTAEERIAWIDKYQTEISIYNTFLRIVNESNFISTQKATGMFVIVGDILRQLGAWRKTTERRK